jgi:hypothetical protein
MFAKVVERALQTRCYKCGNPNTVCVCHHCGHAMCVQHKPATKDATGKLLSSEFANLGLQEHPAGEGAFHCEQCIHFVKAPRAGLIVAGALIALAGVLVAILLQVIYGWIVALAGMVLAVVAFVSYSRKAQELIKTRPLAPLFPRFDTLLVQEELRGHMTLDDDGRYQITAAPASGMLAIAASFGKPERDRLQLFRKKFKLADDADTDFHAGFAVLRGGIGIRPCDPTQNRTTECGTVIPLTGAVSDVPILSGTVGRNSGEWRVTRQYALIETLETATLPIRLVPSLLPESAQRALDLEVQWTNPGLQDNQLTLERIASLELRVPVSWGEVENISESALISIATDAASETAVRTITWRRLSIRREEQEQGHRAFFIRFENNIDLSSVIRGQVEVVFKGALSGVKGIDLLYPLGDISAKAEPSEINTLVSADFELSLSSLRYQDVRVVPDPKREEDRDKQETKMFEGVIPDHTTVMTLTNAMSREGFYVKRVFENPPRSGERANVVNRYWDITGRRYLGVYPIDFHLVLTGEEVHGGEIRALAGTTKIALTVQGTFANPDMEAKIENVWEQLTYLIGETLGSLPRRAPAPGIPTVVVQTPISTVATEPLAKTPVSSVQSDRVVALRNRLDQLLDALLGGRLSEATYLDLKANTERELAGAQAAN